MDETTRDAAGRALADVLEKQAFLFADPGEDGETSDLPLLTTSLRFRGARTGGLAIAAPLGLAREIAAGFLGCEPDDGMAEEKAGDACKELLNIACGQTLTNLFGTEPVFDLGIPESRMLSPAEAADWTAAPDTVAYTVDGTPLFLRVELDPRDGETGAG